MGRSSKRDDVLDTAEALFSAQGFAATGINQITREAGVASMTLYNNFENKDELITATLVRRSEAFFKNIHIAVQAVQDDPEKQINAVFDSIECWVAKELQKPDGFTGCLFLKASNEYLSKTDPVRHIAINHKQKLIAIFMDAATLLGVADPKEFALTLHLLLDGAIGQAQLLSDEKSISRGRGIAASLIKSAMSR